MDQMWTKKANFIRHSLNLFNLLILFSGVALSIAGVLFQTTYKYEHAFLSEKINNVSLMLLGIGLTLVFLGLMGIVSLTSFGNSMMVAFFIIGLMVTTIILTSLGIWTYLSLINQKFVNEAKWEMNTTFIRYAEKYTDSLETKEIDLLQNKFKCCGLISYEDWKISSDKNFITSISKYEKLISTEQISFDLPDTCCRQISENCGKDFRFKKTIHLNGCYEPFIKYFTDRILIMCSISIGLSTVNFLTITFLVYVCFMLKADYSLIYPDSEDQNEDDIVKDYEEGNIENEEITY